MAESHDNSQSVTWSDVPAAVGLLSRLPVRVDTDRATARGAKAAWAYPVAGLALALIAASMGQIALLLSFPAPLTAGLVLTCLIVTSGAMHEDGLADSADGLWGGWDKERRLKIMKDSHIGTYGVLALVLSVGLRWQALTLLIAAGLLWPAVIVAAMLSRAVMVPVMARLPHARDSGLAHAVGKPDARATLLACGIAAVAALMLAQLVGVWLIALAALSAYACARLATAKIGGQTGDILGATQQITEITLLLALTALI